VSKKAKKPEPKRKAKAKSGSQKQQSFNAVDAKRDAMAMFSSSLNVYERGPDKKWRRSAGKSKP
jgi:hypothetical protein